jgi:hypothetical protein
MPEKDPLYFKGRMIKKKIEEEEEEEKEDYLTLIK